MSGITGESTSPETPPTLVVTFENGARSGKGTTVRASRDALREEGFKVRIIDQGLKYRSLTHAAVAAEVNLDAPLDVSTFLHLPQTRVDMLALLAAVDDMEDDERDGLLYTPEMSALTPKIGASSHSKDLAIGLMFDQVQDAAATGIDAVLIDGRTIEKHVRKMQQEGFARHVLSIYFRCDSLTAARREQRLFVPVAQLSAEEQQRLVQAAGRINQRNKDDSQHVTDPLRYPSHSFHFDFERYRNGCIENLLPHIAETNRIEVDTTHTRDIEHMTEPLVAIVKRMLEVEREQALAA